MYRMHARLQKLEAAREAWWNSLSDAELEGLIGEGFNTFLDQQSLETLTQLADGDPDVAAELWEAYLLWRKGQP